MIIPNYKLKSFFFSVLNLEEIIKGQNTVYHVSDTGGGGCPSSQVPHSVTNADWKHLQLKSKWPAATYWI